MRDVLCSITLALLLGAQDVAPSPGQAAPTNGPLPPCCFLKTGPPLRVYGVPQARYDAVSGAATVVLHVARGADLRKLQTYFLSTPNHEPVPMTAEGPVAETDVFRRFGTPPSFEGGEYWRLRGPMPHAASFAVYYDEVWPGTVGATDQPCSGTFRTLVVTAAEGPQLANERGPSGLLRFVPLGQPVSTETLAMVDVPRPVGHRALTPQNIVRTYVSYRAAWYRPLPTADATTMLDTQRGFDVALMTNGPDPAMIEHRYVIARGDGTDDFVLRRFTWSTGDAVAVSAQSTVRPTRQDDGSMTMQLDSGFGTFAVLHIRSRADGLMQIVDVTR